MKIFELFTPTDAFKSWFKNSKVVNADGSPKVMYHGSVIWHNKLESKLGDIYSFDRMSSVNLIKRKESFDTVGNWFDESPDEKLGAGMYAGREGVIYPVYLSIQNPWQPESFDDFLARFKGFNGNSDPRYGEIPKNIRGSGSATGLRNWLKSKGYDGIVFPAGVVDHPNQGRVWVALYPNQIKSAIGNNGEYTDSEKITENIMFNRNKIESIVAFHGGAKDITSFHPWTHFGTKRAAKHRMNNRGWKNTDKGKLYSVILNIKNPLLVSDRESSDEATLLNAILSGKYPAIDKFKARKNGVISAVEEAGYDGLVYINKFEDIDKLSYVIFHSNQVKIKVDELFTPNGNSLHKITNREEFFALTKRNDFNDYVQSYLFNVGKERFLLYFENSNNSIGCGFAHLTEEGGIDHNLQDNKLQFGVFKNCVAGILLFIEDKKPNKILIQGYTSRQLDMYKKCFEHYGSKLLPPEYDYRNEKHEVVIFHRWNEDEDEDEDEDEY